MGIPGVGDRALQSTGGHLLEKCVPPDSECGCQGVLNSMDIHQSVLGCILTPRTAVKLAFPEDFLEISHSSKMWTATKACLTSVTKNADTKVS